MYSKCDVTRQKRGDGFNERSRKKRKQDHLITRWHTFWGFGSKSKMNARSNSFDENFLPLQVRAFSFFHLHTNDIKVKLKCFAFFLSSICEKVIASHCFLHLLNGFLCLEQNNVGCHVFAKLIRDSFWEDAFWHFYWNWIFKVYVYC